MKYLSKIASVACLSIATVSIVGCGGGSKSDTPPPVVEEPTVENPCPIPASIKAKEVSLDQNKTKDTLMLSINSASLGSYIGLNVLSKHTLDEMSANSMKVSNISQLDKNTIEGKIATKVITAVDSIDTLEQKIQSDDILTGDNLLCDNNGTYSFHYADSSSYDEDTNTTVKRFTIQASFDNCVVTEGSEHFNDVAEAIDMVFYNDNILRNIGAMDTNEENSTYIFDGQSEFSGSLLTQQTGYSDENDSDVEGVLRLEVAISNKGIDWRETKGEVVYLSDANLSVSTVINFDGESHKTEDEDGNTTKGYLDITYDLNVSMNGNESFSVKSDENNSESIKLNTLCYSSLYDGELNLKGSTYEGNDGSSSSYGKFVFDMNNNNNGYLSLYEEDMEDNVTYKDFFDVYQNNHQITSQILIEGDEDGAELKATLNVNGTIGATELGGSVDIKTLNTWKSSQEYSKHRQEEEFVNPYIAIALFSPYDGKSSFTSKTDAEVGFGLDSNLTYGYIRTEDDYQEYDSLVDMLDVD